MLPLSLATSSTFYAFIEAFTMGIEDAIHRPERQSCQIPTLEQVIGILELAIYEAERLLFRDNQLY